MTTTDLQPEINSLQIQLVSLTEKFDEALTNDVSLGEARKLFHELKSLQERLDVLRNAELTSSGNEDR